MRGAILLMQALVPANYASIVVLCISVSAIVLTYYGQLVYNKMAVSLFDTAFYMNLVLLTGSYSFAKAVGEDPTLATYILIGVVFFQFLGLILFKIVSIFKWNEQIMACLCKNKRIEEDWEEYEQAALLREKEAGTERRTSKSSRNIACLPTV